MENKVDRKQAVGSLLMQAEKYRNFARWIGDWEENGRPSGRDEEFWLRAEQEFREAEELARETRDDA
jgi:Protein of unknown function (DUF2934)